MTLAGTRRALLGAGKRITYLLRATFSTDLAAPLPASLTTDVGGPLTVTDVSNALSIFGGVLTHNAAVAAGIVGPRLTRTCGRALVWRSNAGGSSEPGAGWFDGTALQSGYNTLTYGWKNRTASIRLDGATITTSAAYNDADKMIVQRGTGAFFFGKSGSTWVLEWVAVLNSGNLSPQYMIGGVAGACTLDNFRVLDLAAIDSRFASDYGLATSRLTSPAAAATTTSTADAVIEWTIGTVSASTSQMLFRYQDATNHWRVGFNSGSFSLTEVVAGAATSRATSSPTLANGSRCVIVQEGAVIKGYTDNVLRWTYSSATNFQTNTDAQVSTLNGTISELVAWPRTITLDSRI